MREFENVYFDADDADELSDQIEQSERIPDDVKSVLHHQVHRAKQCGKRANGAAMQAHEMILAAFDAQKADRNSAGLLRTASDSADRAAMLRERADMEFMAAMKMFLTLTGRND